MKKILMTLAAAFVAVTMSAQVYVGGSFSLASISTQKLVGDQNETTLKIMPEIGYQLNDEWAIGAVIGYQSNKFDGVEQGDNAFGTNASSGISESAFTFNPYARYTFANLGKVNLFVDGGIDFTTYSKSDATKLGVGFKPGLAVSLTDNLSFVSHVCFIGWNSFNPDGDDNNTSAFGLGLSGENLSFGLYYNF
jgi:hypothetical protein